MKHLLRPRTLYVGKRGVGQAHSKGGKAISTTQQEDWMVWPETDPTDKRVMSDLQVRNLFEIQEEIAESTQPEVSSNDAEERTTGDTPNDGGDDDIHTGVRTSDT